MRASRSSRGAMTPKVSVQSLSAPLSKRAMASMAAPGCRLHCVRAQAALYLLVYEAVGDGVQLRERGGVAEHYLAELLAFELSVRAIDAAEAALQRLAQRRAGLGQLVVYLVAVQAERTHVPQTVESRGLARAGAAGEADYAHALTQGGLRYPGSGRAPWRRIRQGARVRSIIVLSLPMPHSPPSMTASILPSK